MFSVFPLRGIMAAQNLLRRPIHAFSLVIVPFTKVSGVWNLKQKVSTFLSMWFFFFFSEGVFLFKPKGKLLNPHHSQFQNFPHMMNRVVLKMFLGNNAQMVEQNWEDLEHNMSSEGFNFIF